MPFLAKRLDQSCRSRGFAIVPRNGDHVFGQPGDSVGIGVADIAPEKQAAIQGRKLVVNLLEEIDIDGTVALLLHLRHGCGPAPSSKVSSAPMWMNGDGNSCGDLREPILDQWQRTGLARRQHMPVRRLGVVGIEIVFEHMVQMAKGLLLRHDGDVILARIGHEFRRFSRRERTSRRRGQRMLGIEQRVLEVRRVDVDFEGGKDANLMLLEGERGERSRGRDRRRCRDIAWRASRAPCRWAKRATSPAVATAV